MHAKRSPFPDLALDRDLSPQQPDDSVAYREAKSGTDADRLGGEERREEPPSYIRRYACSRIGDRDHYATGRVEAGGHGDFIVFCPPFGNFLFALHAAD